MARITVEDCLEYESNRFILVKLASIRAKQLLEGKTPVTDTKGNRAIVSALREIAVGKIHFAQEEETKSISNSIASATLPAAEPVAVVAPETSSPATPEQETKTEEKAPAATATAVVDSAAG